jgi:hypothetical protein
VYALVVVYEELVQVSVVLDLAAAQVVLFSLVFQEDKELDRKQVRYVALAVVALSQVVA